MFSHETLSRTVPGQWDEGARLNLERSLRVGDELGGHIVTGHVDAVATVIEAHADGGSTRLTLAAPASIGKGIAAKGSIALDGVSLTVNSVEDAGGETRFTVNLIPHTLEATTLDGDRGRATAQCRDRHPCALSRADDGAIITAA